VQGQEVSLEDQPPANLVYLLDVSGSMNDPLKLPLLKRGFRMLSAQLRPQDRVSIVTYAGADRVILDGVPGSSHEKIDAAIVNLESGGSTNGAGGIQKAYEIAQKHFIRGGTNRVLLATDGDFNVGLSEAGAPSGNYKDEVGEQLADNGDGIYFYIDGPEETQRAFQHTISGSLMTVAKDVKLQVEFNPTFVKGYRLIGYENRVLSNSAFNDDSVDAGELGAGLSVTALYEIIRSNSAESLPQALEGTEPVVPDAGDGATAAQSGFQPVGAHELAQVRLRYKDSDSTESKAMSEGLLSTRRSDTPSFKLLFAAGISEFAMQLRGSQYLPQVRQSALLDQIEIARVLDREGAVLEAQHLIRSAHLLR
jgi:Ca-activated chloride channel family protein